MKTVEVTRVVTLRAEQRAIEPEDFLCDEFMGAYTQLRDVCPTGNLHIHLYVEVPGAEAVTPMPTLEQRVEELLTAVRRLSITRTEASINPDDWLRFLHSIALADHMGDAAGDVRDFAELVGLPMPPGDADFEGWLDWTKNRGVDEGCAAALLRRKEGEP